MNSKFYLAILVVAMLIASGCVSVTKPEGNATDEDIATEVGEIDELVGEAQASGSASDEGLPTKTVVEGEKVSFPNLKAVDPDGDAITYSFTAPLDAAGEWQTEKGDAGRYKVTITASDGANDVSQDVLIIVKSSNKPPVIAEMEDIEIEEGQTVQLAPSVSDPEGDDVVLTYSGWMDSSKKKTSYEDAGVHTVTVTASDGQDSVSREITVKVSGINRPPAIDSAEDISVSEGELASADVGVSDPDGDDVSLSFSEPLNDAGKWQTAKGDAGKYMVKVTASDGSLGAEKTFYVTVKSTDKAPVLEGVADIEVTEGDLIELDITASDPEGKDVTVTFSAPFDSDGSWQTGYADAGEYVVTVTASDGASETEETFNVVVNDENRAPVFVAGSFK